VKKLIFIVLLFASVKANALPATSIGGHTACAQKVWLDDLISFVAAGDRGSFQAYIDSNKCIVLKKGLRVTITESPAMFGGTAGFVYNGIRLWTVREAFDYGR